MKRLGLIAIAIMAIALFVPQAGSCYEVTSAVYNGAGVLVMERTYDITTPNDFKRIMHYDGFGLRLFMEGNGEQGYYTTNWNYNGTKLLSTVTSGNGLQDYKGIYDATGQVAFDYYLEKADGTWIGDAIQQLAIFLGNPDNSTISPGNGGEALTDQGRIDIALQGAAGALLRDGGLVSVTNSNTNTHSGFNFSLANGHFIKSWNVDTNNDGVLDRTYSFGGTANNWATGSSRISLFLSGISQKNNAGSPTGFNFGGKHFDGAATFADPSKYHDKGSNNPDGNNTGHWDPAVTMNGTLGKDNNGYYIVDSNGGRHNLEVNDANIANQLSANIGQQVSVTGDTEDNDTNASLIYLQEFSVV